MDYRLTSKYWLALLRILLGLAALAGAYLQWGVALATGPVGHLGSPGVGHRPPGLAFISSLTHGAGFNSGVGVYAAALILMIMALGLILGLFLRLVYIGGFISSATVLWLTVQGSQGLNATDLPAAGGMFALALFFLALWVGDSGAFLSLDKVWGARRGSQERRRYRGKRL